MCRKDFLSDFYAKITENLKGLHDFTMFVILFIKRNFIVFQKPR